MADSPWMQRIETGLGELARRAHRRPATALVACAAVTVLGVLGSSRLSLVADLEQLLPKTFQSVRDLEPVRQRFGGIGYVCLVGIDAEPDAMRRFADDMVPKLQKLAGIRYVEYQRPFKFFEERSLYFLDLEDLREVARRIQAREKWERRQRNPMFIKLDDEPAPPLDFSDIEAKYGRRTDQRLAGTGEDYYLDPDKRMVVLLAKPTHTSADLAFSQKLIDTVEEFLVAEGLSCVNCDRPTPEGPAAAAPRGSTRRGWRACVRLDGVG